MRTLLLLLASIPSFAAITFVQGAGAFVDGTATTIAVTRTGVTAGNLIFVWVKFEEATTTVTCSDGTSSLTQGPQAVVTHSNNDLNGSLFYLLSSVASGSVTYTCTLGATRAFRQITMMEFDTDSGETLSTDGSNEAFGTGTSLASGTITTTGTDVVVIGTFGNYASTTSSAEQIGGTNAGGRQQASTEASSMWYRILTSTMTGGQATATISMDPYISQILAIKSEAGGSTFRRMTIIQ